MLVHAGPFGNIAHAANSILADRIALKLADYVDHRSRLRQRPRDAEVLRHRLPHGAASGERRGARDHGPGDEVARRHGVRGPRQGGPGGDAARRRQSHRAHPDRAPVRAAVRGRRSTAFRPTRRQEMALRQESWRSTAGAETVVVHEGFAQGRRRRRRAGRRRSSRRASKPNAFTFITPNETPLVEQIEAIATQALRRRRHRPADAGAEGSRAHREARDGHGDGVHGQDASLAVARSRCCGTGRPASSCRSQRWCRARAPASSSRCAATCSGCRASARRRPSSTSTSTMRAGRWDCSDVRKHRASVGQIG